jgi:multidrug transporter EmrE-like cation transporter
MRQDYIETFAKSEVVTVCSWQFVGEEIDVVGYLAMLFIVCGITVLQFGKRAGRSS